jgi:dTDP-glucose 4,6-dehydratase
MNKVNTGQMELFFGGLIKPSNVLFVSSSEVYGATAPALVSEDFIGKIDERLARSSYPLSKLHAEESLKNLGDEHGCKTSIARLFHTFGPGLKANDGRSFSDFLESAISGNPPTLRSSGSDIRSFLFTLDAVTAFFKIISKPIVLQNESGTFNVGSSEALSIFDFAEKVSEICGVARPVIDSKTPLASMSIENSPNSTLLPDTSKLASIGWQSRFDVDYAIRRTFEWMLLKS